MINLPKNTIPGKLKIEETFEFFDFPRLFLCTNNSTLKYLALSTFDDGDQFEWLYLPISSSRITALSRKDINLRFAFKNPEDGFLIRLISNFQGESSLEHVFPEQVPDEDLPLETAFLRRSAEGKTYGLGVVDPRQSASASNRETYNIHLYPCDSSLPELSSKSAANILLAAQELTAALGQAKMGNPTIRGPIATEILEQTQMNLAQVFEGSFGMQLKANKPSDLWGSSLLLESIQEIINLLSAADSEDKK